MADLPTLYLTNWSSRRLHGPGQKWTIMARPRAWERGAGVVVALTPDLSDLVAAKSGTLSEVEYFARFREKMLRHSSQLAPGIMRAAYAVYPAVCDGDTLLCACAIGAPCHRREVAPFLVRAGWRVILDGVEAPRG